MNVPGIRIGVIGVGQIGKHHIANYAKIAGVEVVAVADVNRTELDRAAEEHGIPHRFGDFRELLARDDIDAVDVCLHNNFHAPVSIAALQAGKHVYCEKPIAGCYCDGKAMVDAAERCGRKLSVQLSTVFDKETHVARRMIADGRLGRIYHARSYGYRRRGRPFVDGYGTDSFVKKSVSGGGALFDMGVYHLAQLMYLMGNPAVDRITGATYQETEMDEGRRVSSGYDVEELGVGFVRLAGGATLDVLEAWAVHLDAFPGSCLAGTKGGLRFNPLRFFTTESDVLVDATVDVKDADWRRHQLTPEFTAYDGPQQHWIAALQGRVDLIPTDRIALQVMLISEGIYLSQRLQREVTAREVQDLSRSAAVNLACS